MKYYGITLGCNGLQQGYSEHYFVSEDGERYLEVEKYLTKDAARQLPDFFAENKHKMGVTKYFLSEMAGHGPDRVFLDYVEVVAEMIIESVPNNLEETLAKLGDYALYGWLIQIEKGETLDNRLDARHAMLLARLILYADRHLSASKEETREFLKGLEPSE